MNDLRLAYRLFQELWFWNKERPGSGETSFDVAERYLKAASMIAITVHPQPKKRPVNNQLRKTAVQRLHRSFNDWVDTRLLPMCNS